jgi:hypothetical protein
MRSSKTKSPVYTHDSPTLDGRALGVNNDNMYYSSGALVAGLEPGRDFRVLSKLSPACSLLTVRTSQGSDIKSSHLSDRVVSAGPDSVRGSETGELSDT